MLEQLPLWPQNGKRGRMFRINYLHKFMNAKDIKKEDLKAIFDQCMKALSQDDLDGATEFFTAEMRKSGMDEAKTPALRAQSLQMAKSMMPISCEATSIDVDGEKVTLHMSATLNDIFDPGTIISQDMDIVFSQESGVWKMGKIEIHDHHDELKIAKSADVKADPNGEYDENSTISLSAGIDSVKFEKSYTLIVMKMSDEEDLIYLPKKADLGTFGLKAKQLVPGAFIQISGHRNKTNKFKILAFKADIS